MHKSQPSSVGLLRASAGGTAVRRQLRGYEEPPASEGIDDLVADGAADALSRIAEHLFAQLRGSKNLVFGGLRHTVERLADRLGQARARAGGRPASDVTQL